jgi:hypothetical protein
MRIRFPLALNRISEERADASTALLTIARDMRAEFGEQAEKQLAEALEIVLYLRGFDSTNGNIVEEPDAALETVLTLSPAEKAASIAALDLLLLSPERYPCMTTKECH